MTLIVNDLTSGAGLFLSPYQQQEIGDNIQKYLVMPDMTQQDNQVQLANDQVKNKAIKIFGAFISIALAVVAFITIKYGLNISEILKYSLIMLVLVALTEYSFVTIVSKNYQIIDPNYVRSVIAKNLAQYSKQP